MLITEHSHQRIGKSAAESPERFDGNGNRDGRLDHQVARAFAGKIQYRCLAGEKPSLGAGDDGGKSGAAPSFDALVGEAHLVGSIAPRSRVGTIFWTARGFTHPAKSALRGRCGRWRRNFHVPKRINPA